MSLFSMIGEAVRATEPEPQGGPAPQRGVPTPQVSQAQPVESTTGAPAGGLLGSLRQAVNDATNRIEFEEEEDAMPVMNGTINRSAAVTRVFQGLEKFEGREGDTTGAAKTGRLGVTAALRQRLRVPANVPDEQVAQQYLGQIYDKMPDYMRKGPPVFVEAVMDQAYNLGEGMLQFRGFNAAARQGDWLGAMRNLLDTASIDGQASRGLAARRAFYYNKVAVAMGQPTIARVQQVADGTLRYLSRDGGVIFQYRAPRGRHSTSRVGEVSARVPLPPTIARQETIYRDDEGRAFRLVDGRVEPV